MNKVYISPFQMGFTMGWESLLNESIFTKEDLDQIDLQKLLFNFLIQCGAQEILLLGLDTNSYKNIKVLPPNIKSRITPLNN